MRLANISQLGIKELCGLSRDIALIVLIVYAFTLSIYTASRAIPETLNRASIAIVDEDHSPLSSRITSAFYPPYFLEPLIIDHSEMDMRMDSGLDTFALDILPNFQRDLLAGKAPAIQLNIDATRMSQAFAGGGYIQTIVSNEIREFLQRYRSAPEMPVDLVLRARFNPELNKSWFGAVTNVISSITMLVIVLTGAALIREREHGTIEHLLVMPVTPFEIMVSKIWSMSLVVLIASSLSYGLQRRLEIARALAAGPRVLLLDEPAAGMNPAEVRGLVNLIRDVRDMGVTILLIEHDMNVVMDISDRIIVLDYGNKIAEGTPGEIRSNSRVIEAYLGREDQG